MKNKVINAFFVTMITLVGTVSLSGGYLYAAQNGVGAEDRKQLGLFNGNDEFMGTVVGIDMTDYYSLIYTSYFAALNVIIPLRASASSASSLEYGTTFLLHADRVFFATSDCTGTGHVGYLRGPLYDASVYFIPQIVFSTQGDTHQFVIDSAFPSPLTSQSMIDESGSCVIWSEETTAWPAHEIVLPFSLAGLPTIKPL